MRLKTTISGIALVMALVLQAGFCPMCLVSDCDMEMESPVSASMPSCCSQENAESTPKQKTDGCSTCGDDCEKGCYKLETNLVVASSNFTILHQKDMTSVDVVLDSIPASHVNLHLNYPRGRSIPSDLPPPDIVACISCTELLL